MSPLDYPWWLASRAAGITAYALLSVAILLGLASAMRVAPPAIRAQVVELHNRIALVAVGMTAFHGLILLGDSWLHPALTQLLIPFTMSYRPLFTGLGTLAAYVTWLLALSFYARRRLGTRRWRAAHRFIPAAWILASVHVIGAGTDASSLWLQVPLYGTIAGTVIMLLSRWTASYDAAKKAVTLRL